MGYYESPVFKTRSQQEGAIRLDLDRGTEFSTCDAAHLALVEEIDRVRGQLKDNPSKALRDRLTSLEEQKAAVIMHKGEIAAQVDERAKKLLQLVKRPATVEQGIDEVMGVLYCIVLSEKNLCSVKRPERSLNGRLR